MSTLSHVALSHDHTADKNHEKMSRRLMMVFSSAIALHISPGLAQTESTRILEKGEVPRVVNVRKGVTHTDTKPGMNGGRFTITSTVETASPSASLQGTKGFGQVVDTPYGKLSFAEIQKHEKKDEILGKMKPSQRDKFDDWEIEVANQTEKKLDTNIQVANQRIEAKKQVEQVANQTERKIDKELIEVYSQLIINAEKGASIKKKTLLDIIKNPITPEELRNRANLLLRNA